MQQKDFADSIFWVELDRISPNPQQPRREFDEAKLNELAESIRQYGLLQPIVVTRHETVHENGGLSVAYELISGERRLRASRIAGLSLVPAVIRTREESEVVKLELAIIENVQREDLNPVDRALALKKLADEFKLSLADVGRKIGKSREYVSNTVRILGLPEKIRQALIDKKISESHTRPLLMLVDRPEQQDVLFQDIVMRKLSTREAELIARRIATERARKVASPEILDIEQKLTETLGTKVHIEEKDEGGRIMIRYFSQEDLRALLEKVMLGEHPSGMPAVSSEEFEEGGEEGPVDDIPKSEQEEQDQDLYSIRNFSV